MILIAQLPVTLVELLGLLLEETVDERLIDLEFVLNEVHERSGLGIIFNFLHMIL